jgi:hypothetical protein
MESTGMMLATIASTICGSLIGTAISLTYFDEIYGFFYSIEMRVRRLLHW